MPEFMVDVNLHSAHSDEFLKLIPSQRSVVNDMMFEGKITSYCVSMDRSKLWLVIVAKNEEDVMDLLSKFPLIQFMDCEITPLLFYNSAQQTFSHISLN
ncbi:MAG: muconolactone Delta-isomerase family protein [Chitinophagales bacterium]